MGFQLNAWNKVSTYHRLRLFTHFIFYNLKYIIVRPKM